MCYHSQLIFVFLVETGFHYIGQGGLKLLNSSDPLALASQSAGITGVSHCARLVPFYIKEIIQPIHILVSSFFELFEFFLEFHFTVSMGFLAIFLFAL